MEKQFEYCAGGLLWLVAGAVIRNLVDALGSHTFQRHVDVFHSLSTAVSQTMRFIADLGRVLRPVAWFGSMIGVVYYCRRRGLPCLFVLLFGFMAAAGSFLCNGYVHADPGPNFNTSEIYVPLSVQVGCLLGIVAHAWRGEWRSGRTK